VSCGLSHEERRERLIAAWGRPRQVTAGEVPYLLALLGIRRQVHPRDVTAFSYRDADAARAWGQSTEEHYGIPSLGTLPLPGDEVAGVYDLRPALTSHGADPTDPAHPDGWAPDA
jgi:hypothetical protein